MTAKRVFTPARIVALAVIGILLFCLAYARFAPSNGSVSVPAGAKAGDLRLLVNVAGGLYPGICPRGRR